MPKKLNPKGKIKFLESQKIRPEIIRKAMGFHDDFSKCVVWMAQQCQKWAPAEMLEAPEWRKVLDYCAYKQQQRGNNWNVNDYEFQRVSTEAFNWHRQLNYNPANPQTIPVIESCAMLDRITGPEEGQVYWVQETGTICVYVDGRWTGVREDTPRKKRKYKHKYRTHEMVWSNDEYEMVRLETAGDCKAEGEKMGHCVGSYAQKLGRDGFELYSLRDKKNQPHVTIQVTKIDSPVVLYKKGEVSYSVNQLYGKSNKLPKEKYQKVVLDWMSTLKMDIESIIKLHHYITIRNEKIEQVLLKEIRRTKQYGMGLEYLKLKVFDRFTASGKMGSNTTVWDEAAVCSAYQSLLLENIDEPEALKAAVKYAEKYQMCWKEIETELLKPHNKELAIEYAISVRGRWPQFELLISKSPWVALSYTTEVLGGKRFKEAEEYMKASIFKDVYERLVGEIL